MKLSVNESLCELRDILSVLRVKKERSFLNTKGTKDISKDPKDYASSFVTIKNPFKLNDASLFNNCKTRNGNFPGIERIIVLFATC
jgi:hypothetical protein